MSSHTSAEARDETWRRFGGTAPHGARLPHFYGIASHATQVAGRPLVAEAVPMPMLCEAERAARPCGEVAHVAFRMGHGGLTTIVPRCRSHAVEFRNVLRRFMREGTWSEEENTAGLSGGSR